MLKEFEEYLLKNEKSSQTIEKYVRDVRFFLAECPILGRKEVLDYKEKLQKIYKISSANSMLAAMNCYLKFLGRGDLCVKQFKVQKKVYAEKELTKGDYEKLIRAADPKLSLLIQTLCATGIRVSELEFITVEAVKQGVAVVQCKGKTRTVFIVSALRKKLLQFAGKRTGPIFVTKSGKPLDRSNIWRMMKALCKKAGVDPEKVFPHNLRHLFARTFYGIEKDIAKLADILGHSNINTTRIYLVTTPEEHRRRMEKMHLIL